MRIIFTLLFIINLSVSGYSQYPPDFIAPDFTATDINGEEHNLYELLDDGKTVIIDFFTTWCGPCWTFHSSHILNDVWNELGPNGTDEVYIFSIEVDLDTNSDELNGIGSSTQGNWVDGTLYPIIDETDPGEGSASQGKIGYDYNILGYPTILFICPSRKVTSVNWQAVGSSYLSTINNCPATGLSGDNNMRIENYEGVEGIICEAETFSPKVTFRNLGNSTVTSANISLTVNGTTENYTYEGELSPYYTDEFEFPDITTSNSDIIIEISEVNNSPDDFPDNNILETSILLPLTTEVDTVTVEVLTDEYGAETYWAILNENDEIIGEGGNQLVGFDVTVTTNGTDVPVDSTAYENETLYTTEVYLPLGGCYRFVIADYYLDGIFGDGYFKVISQDNGALVDGDGEFTEPSENPFGFVQTVSSIDLYFSDLELFPNPILYELTIKIPEDLPTVQMITFYDLQGKALMRTSNYSINDKKITIDLSSFYSGLYLLKVKLEDGSIAQGKIIKY